jgi:hypothetical protein
MRRRGHRIALGASLLVLALLLGACGGGDDPEAAAGTGAVLLAAGDIAECGSGGDEATAKLLGEEPAATIAPLGDVAYQHGTAQNFADCFDPSWGRYRDRMRPAVGNHDLATKDARPYSEYFGEQAGPFDRYMYAYDLGPWRVVVANSDCWRIGGCEDHDPQVRWLRDQVRAAGSRCVLAYWHRPPFSSGRYGDEEDTARVRPLWRAAAEEGVDVVLTGHEHSYERFEPMSGDGVRVASGTRLFVVGTGGGNLRPYQDPPLQTTAVRQDDTLGVLRLALRDGGYDWAFRPVAGGRFRDSGSAQCG